ncbi:MAG: TetR/AcrR family transcriptional regulator [Oscillospiraceae bacterium]|nr:TetR/AcrR family transcriptional regulator [Oscillospiraceae bacterium]
MPTNTFYHLPEAKRQKLIDAIRQELLRVPYEEISINKIIQNAGIPRGSFYQYFTGKNDMIQMILGDFQIKITEISKKSLQEHGGDPFTLTQDIFDLICRISERTDLFLLYHNLLGGMKVKDDRAAHLPFCLSHGKNCEWTALLNTALLDLRGESDLSDCIEILASLLKGSIVELLAEPERKAKIAVSFQNKIAILRRGMDPKQEAPTC